MKRMAFMMIAAGFILSTSWAEETQTERKSWWSGWFGKKKTEAPVAETNTSAKKETAKSTKKSASSAEAFVVKGNEVLDDINLSIEAIKKKVSGLDQTQLLAYADKYKEIFLEKKGQIEVLSNTFANLNMTEKFSEKGLELKDQLAQYGQQIGALKARYEIYLEKLKTLGVDLSAYGL